MVPYCIGVLSTMATTKVPLTICCTNHAGLSVYALASPAVAQIAVANSLWGFLLKS